jgi:hypothetical protein
VSLAPFGLKSRVLRKLHAKKYSFSACPSKFLIFANMNKRGKVACWIG